jgi:hypothetical protein
VLVRSRPLSEENFMFGFQSDERPDTISRKKTCRQDALWRLLIHFDLSAIANEARSGIPEAQATSDVHASVQGKPF